LVSGLRSNSGASHELLLAIRYGDLDIALSVALAIEYESVAIRKRLIPHLSTKEIQDVIDVFCQLAHQQKIFFAWRPFLKDPGDDLVLEVAVAAGCQYIITHNIKDFGGIDALGIQAITPAQALNLI
jgi:predicted nucleic acid-binding protein